LFKGDISRKTNFFKCEDFTGIDSLEILKTDLNSINLVKEQKAINKLLLKKHNQWVGPKVEESHIINPESLDLNPSNYR